ncbi:MAG: hypothetical protein A3F68_03125, partial [Acidobacteria bacterium RIFCSPLOWO2_12_FULL_54_10]
MAFRASIQSLLLASLLFCARPFWAANPPAPAPELLSMGRALLDEKASGQRQLLEKFAQQAPDELNSSLAYLLLGYDAFSKKQYTAASQNFKLADQSASLLRDTAEYYLALSEIEKGNPKSAAEVLQGFAARFPASPFAAPATLLYAETLLQLNRFADAIALLTSSTVTLPQPDAAMLLGEAFEKDGQLLPAVAQYREVYYSYPASSQADLAEKRLNSLRTRLGSKYPDTNHDQRIVRAERLSAANQWSDAGREFQLLSALAQGEQKQSYLLRMGAAQYRARATWPSLSTLQKLKLTIPDEEAERLFTLAALFRRLGRNKDVEGYVQQLAEKHPQSKWYAEALFLAANQALAANELETADRYYRLVYKVFPSGEIAAISHWKVSWYAFRQRRLDEASRLFDEHLRTFSDSPQVSAALYWRGRLLERESAAAAAACYRKLVDTFPNFYYGLKARQRLEELPKPLSSPGPAASLPFDNIHRPSAASPANNVPVTRWEANLTRIRLLESAWLIDLAIEEVQTVIAQDSAASVLGPVLARLESNRGHHHIALRYGKRYVTSYYSRDLKELSRPVWETLFPLPYWADIQKNANASKLDAYVVAGLIRQESEFNPTARSRSNARGLMQLLPSTAR